MICVRLLAAGLMAVAVPAAAKPAASELTTQSVDRAELEAVLDGFMEEHMAALQAPAAVFALVQGGKLVLAKGWGVTDRDDRQPVHPAHTVFRMASISKVFTTTAIMQLVERGLVDLNADVNDYLRDLRVRDGFDEPVRIWHLMSHTAGFEDRIVGIAARNPEEQSMRRYLKEHQPYRVVPPGQQISYSNYSTNLLGLVVEEVTGRSFEDYVRDDILLPLGMVDSSFAAEPGLMGRLATGYVPLAGGLQRVPDITINMVASSTLVSTAEDMARFIAAHLNQGALPAGYPGRPAHGGRILAEETTRRMHSTLFTQHPLLPGNAHGFWEHDIHGLRLLQHAGEWFGYQCLMVLIPELDAGWIVAHTGGDARFRTALNHTLLDRVFPRRALQAPVHVAAQDVSRYAGNYRWNRYVRRSFGKVVSLMDYLLIRLDANADGTLTINYPGNLIPPQRFVQVDDDLFQRSDGDGYLAFRNLGGELHIATHVYELPIVAEQIATLALPAVQLHTGMGAAAITLSGLLLLPLGAWWRRRRGHRVWSGWSDGVAIGVTCSYVVFFVGLMLVLGPPMFIEPAFGVPSGLHELVYMPVVSLGLTVLLLAALVWAWVRGHGTLVGRAYLTLLALSSLWLVYSLFQLNVMPGGVS